MYSFYLALQIVHSSYLYALRPHPELHRVWFIKHVPSQIEFKRWVVVVNLAETRRLCIRNIQEHVEKVGKARESNLCKHAQQLFSSTGLFKLSGSAHLPFSNSATSSTFSKFSSSKFIIDLLGGGLVSSEDDISDQRSGLYDHSVSGREVEVGHEVA